MQRCMHRDRKILHHLDEGRVLEMARDAVLLERNRVAAGTQVQ